MPSKRILILEGQLWSLCEIVVICGAGEIRKANVEVDSASRTAPGHGAPSAEVFETIVIRLKWHLFRLCHLRKWSNFQGYGFNLHTDRSKVIIIIIIVVVTVVFFVVIVVIIMVIIIMFIIVMFIIVMFIIAMSMYRRVSWLGMLIQSLQRMQPGSRREIRLLR